MEWAKYQGVNIQQNLSWNIRINQVAKKANNTRAFLHGTSALGKQELCYKTLVRLHVEYASMILDPPTANNINKLEMVQRT